MAGMKGERHDTLLPSRTRPSFIRNAVKSVDVAASDVFGLYRDVLTAFALFGLTALAIVGVLEVPVAARTTAPLAPKSATLDLPERLESGRCEGPRP